MRIKSLNLHNFKKHENLHLNFSEGLNVIRGPNWAGKSTILNAILFTLFGVSAIAGRKETVIRKGATSMFSILVFSDDQDDYEIKRTLSNCVICKNDDEKPIASGISACDEWITKKFGLDKKTALELISSPQSQTAALLSLGVSKINALVENLSGANQVEVLIGKAAKKVKDLTYKVESIQVDDIQERLEKEIVISESRLMELEVARDTMAAEVREAEDQLSRLVADKETALSHNARIAAARAARKRQLDCYQKAEEHEQAAAGAEEEASKIVIPEAPGERLAEVLELQAKSNADGKKLAELTHWFQTTGQEWIDGEKLISSLNTKLADLKDLKNSEEGARLTHTQINSDYALAVKELEALNKVLKENKCPTCKRAFDECVDDVEASLPAAQEKVASLKAELEKATKTLDSATWSVSKLQTEIRALERKIPPEGYEATYNGKVKELEEVSGERPDYREEIAALKAQEATVRTLLTKKSSLEQKAENHRKFAKSCTEDGNRCNVEGHDEQEQNVDDLVQKTEVAKNLLTLNRNEANKAVESYAALEATIKQLKIREQEVKEKQAQKAAAESQLARWDGFLRWLRNNKTRMLSELWNSILAQAGEFLEQATNGRATGLVRSESGDFAVIEDEEEMPCDGGISGGMAAIAGTALKLSLGSLLPSVPKFLLLDEPSSELNDENAANLASALSGTDLQILMVTHRTGEEFVANQIIELQ